MCKDNVIVATSTEWHNNLTVLPRHVAFILDGNRRWARKHGKTVNFGHQRGVRNIERICNLCKCYKIKYLTLYCLSVENLNRSKQELRFLFSCIKRYLTNDNMDKIHKNGIQLTIIGDFKLLPNDVADCIADANKNISAHADLNLQVCIGYSGRNEILNCIKNIVRDIKDDKIGLNEVIQMQERDVEKFLITGQYPDVDLMIRTGGDCRISNFLLWKLSYAELYFCEKFFPEFADEDFLLALYNFQNRHRRYGE